MQKYEEPLCEVIVFENLDIVRTSLGVDNWVEDGSFSTN